MLFHRPFSSVGKADLERKRRALPLRNLDDALPKQTEAPAQVRMRMLRAFRGRAGDHERRWHAT